MTTQGCDFIRVGPVDTAGNWLEIPVATATRDVAHTIGEVTRSQSGGARSTVQSEKYRWTLNTPPLPIADAQTIESVLVPGAAIGVDGSGVDNVQGSYIPRVTTMTPVGVSGSHLRILVIELVEV